MPDLPNRRQRENQLATYLLLVWDDFRLLYERSGTFNLTSFRDRMASGLVDPLAKTYEAAGRQLADKYGVKLPGYDVAARRWSTEYARKLAMEVASTTADLERQAREAIAKGEITREEATKTIFGLARVENISITETTNAASYGEQPPVEIYNAQSDTYLRPLWYTEQDARVCEVCGPLHGTGPQVYGKVSISGPPAHPRCRCWLEYEEAGPAPESADPTPREKRRKQRQLEAV